MNGTMWFTQGFVALSVVIVCCSRSTNDQLRCTSDLRCRCYKHQGHSAQLVADCSGLELKKIPKFWDNVTVIYINSNNISMFSTNLPNNLSYLDISNNNLQQFGNDTFRNLKNLQHLNLQGNKLRYVDSVYTTGLFRNLEKLKYLNIKKNNEKFTQENNGTYPVVLAEIKNLETLLMDGLFGANFPSAFYNLTKLTFMDQSGKSGKCILKIIDTNYYRQLPHLKHLDISSCYIRIIERGALKPLHSLRYFNISSNERLTFSVLQNITYDLQFTDIRVLDVSKLHCTYGASTSLYIKDIYYLNMTRLERLYMDSNRLAVIQEGLPYFSPSTLEHVSLRDNILTMGVYIFQTQALTNLNLLDGSFQHLAHDPTEKGANSFQYCYDWRGPEPTSDLESPSGALRNQFPGDDDEDEPMLNYTYRIRGHFNSIQHDLSDQDSPPDLGITKQYQDEEIFVKHNFANTMPVMLDDTSDIKLPPKLEEVRFSTSNLKYVIPRLKLAKNVVKRVDVSGNFFYEWKGPILNMENVEYVDLSNNFCSNLSYEFFENFYNLQVLNASFNFLGFSLKSDLEGRIFGNLTNLTTLHLSDNKIDQLPSSIFQSQLKLEILNLNSNLIYNWTVRIAHMVNLKQLDLSTNQLTTLTKKARSDIDIILKNSRNLSIDLTGNRLECSCATLEFLRWIKGKQVVFSNFDNYTCYVIGARRFSEIDDILIKLKKDCNSYIGLIIGVSIAIVCCIMVILAGVVYRYRWKLRYLYYMTKNRHKGYSTVTSEQYRYDAFISYADEDRRFVTHTLLEFLETNHSLKLCIHNRDFIPGLEIASNITSAIHKSRKTVVILTKNYLKSYWCMYEFNMARMESCHSRDGDDVLFLVLYESIPARELPLSLMDLIDTTSYITYPHDEQGNVTFWENLALAISI